MSNSHSFHLSRKSRISHELRIPLTGIMGVVQLLNKTFLTSQQKDYLEIIQSSARRLLDLETKLQTIANS